MAVSNSSVSIGLDANTSAIGPSLKGITVVSRIIKALLAVRAPKARNTAAHDGLDTDAGKIAGQAATRGVIWVVDADLSVIALEGCYAIAATWFVCVRWERRKLCHCGRLDDGHQSLWGSCCSRF